MTIFLNNNRLLKWFFSPLQRAENIVRALAFCAMLSGGCDRVQSHSFLVEVKSERKVAVDGIEMPVKRLYAYMKDRKTPSLAGFIFICDSGSVHADLLHVQRILSTLGYYQFSLLTEEGTVPVIFGIAAEQAVCRRLKVVSRIFIDTEDGKTNDQNLAMSNIVPRAATILDFSASHPKDHVIIEIVCDYTSSNESLTQVVTTLHSIGYTNLFIASK